ncbi:hypothetical protein QTO34_004981 [Cnephaeus nilssonii]|uniref:Epidermal growth factor-like protein 7 n=1 Tax=Cnephaeus nilssonii TaxID=3371016 RepID=A0AA40HMQ3_CNENI|nr:hypothetical protein QTO34_004981 [Eptesicus nilssonii]
MGGCRELLLLWALVLAAGGTELVYRPGRRVCAVGVPQGPVTESFMQRVYQPFLTTCGGHRVCSTYRTIYKTAYRRSPGPAPARPRYACCPGWKRTRGLPGACGAAICQPPCQNGGSCVQPGRCHCPAGWQGGSCQTDVGGGSAAGGRARRCVSTAGSYWGRVGRGTAALRAGCSACPGEGPRVAPNPTRGAHGAVQEEVQRLRTRVDVLEQKLQLVLEPLHSLASRALDHGLRDPGPLPGPLLPAAGPHRLPERAGVLPGGAAGVLFLQEGAVTGPPPPQLCTAPLSWEDAPPLLSEGRGRAGRGVQREFSPCTQQARAQESATEPGALGPLTRPRVSWGAPP